MTTTEGSRRSASGNVVVCAVGDVLIKQSDPGLPFAFMREAMKGADIRFGNCEAAYSDTRERNPVAVGHFACKSSNVAGLERAGFNVMSVANNHILDSGYSGLFDTIESLNAVNIATAGGGRNVREARRPAVLEVNGTKVAFLAYTCHVPPGFGAGTDKPGCATIKVDTHVELKQAHPGEISKLSTSIAAPDGLDFSESVAKAAKGADRVFVSLHGGLGQVRGSISDYERELAHLAIDAGADVILGHGQHIIKGVEVYKGRPIVYGLGNFVFNFTLDPDPEGPPADAASGEQVWAFPFSDDCRLSMAAFVGISAAGVYELNLLPVVINGAGQPTPIDPADPEFDRYLKYLREITVIGRLNGKYSANGHLISVAIQ